MLLCFLLFFGNDIPHCYIAKYGNYQFQNNCIGRCTSKNTHDTMNKCVNYDQGNTDHHKDNPCFTQIHDNPPPKIMCF